jgi:hypothetical protein
MSSNIKITDPKELGEFVRTHLGHRLTAMAAPICLPENHPCWCGRNDAYRSAKEGSYSMLRMFIEFLGVKSTRDAQPTLREAHAHEADTILIDAFVNTKVTPAEFGAEQGFIADIHRTLCKIDSHFTYDPSPAKDYYDRIASPSDGTDWTRAVEIVIQKLDRHFYLAVKQPITVHFHLEGPFRERFVASLGLQSPVRGDGLGRPKST